MHSPWPVDARPQATRIARAVLIVGLTAAGCRSASEHPSTLTTDGGRFVVTLHSDVTPIPVNAIHAWTLRVTQPDGSPVEGATITLAGGMPAHAHGLPTVPEIVPGPAPGDYRILGMKFSMPGHWTLTPTVWAGGVRDAATFSVDLP